MRRTVYANLISDIMSPALNDVIEATGLQLNADAKDDNVTGNDIAVELGQVVPNLLLAVALAFSALLSRQEMDSPIAGQGALAALGAAIATAGDAEGSPFEGAFPKHQQPTTRDVNKFSLH